MSTAPFLSVIVPVYNVEQYLTRTLESLHQQTLQKVEFLLVNDGSTDSSATICQQFVEKDTRFRFFEKENGGPSAARNLALTQARGEWVSFFDSDDLLLDPKGLAHLARLLHDTPCDCLRFDYKAIDENDNELWDETLRRPRQATLHETPLPIDTFVQAIIQSDFFSCLLVVKKEWIDAQGIAFPTEYHFIEDIHWLLRLLPHLKRGYYTPYPLYGYRKLSTSLSYQKSTKERCEHFCQALACALLYEEQQAQTEACSRAYLHIAYRLYHTVLSLLGRCTHTEQRALLKAQQLRALQRKLVQLSRKAAFRPSLFDHLSFHCPIAATTYLHCTEKLKERLYTIYTRILTRSS